MHSISSQYCSTFIFELTYDILILSTIITKSDCYIRVWVGVGVDCESALARNSIWSFSARRNFLICDTQANAHKSVLWYRYHFRVNLKVESIVVSLVVFFLFQFVFFSLLLLLLVSAVLLSSFFIYANTSIRGYILTYMAKLKNLLFCLAWTVPTVIQMHNFITPIVCCDGVFTRICTSRHAHHSMSTKLSILYDL